MFDAIKTGMLTMAGVCLLLVALLGLTGCAPDAVQRTARIDAYTSVAEEKEARASDETLPPEVRAKAADEAKIIRSVIAALKQADAELKANDEKVAKVGEVVGAIPQYGDMIKLGVTALGGILAIGATKKWKDAEKKGQEWMEATTQLVGGLDYAKQEDPAFKAAFKTASKTMNARIDNKIQTVIDSIRV